MVELTNQPGVLRFEISAWPVDGRLALPTPFPEIVSARLLGGGEPLPLSWVFNTDASQLTLELGPANSRAIPARCLVETAERTGQLADGRIVFLAADAQVTGGHARLESHPGNHRIGFWTDPSNSVTWDYKPTRWGMYDVELTYSAEGGDGTEVEVELAGKTLTGKRPSTGSWYRYRTLPLGRFYLAKAEPFVVRAGCKRMTGAAVMNLKALTLRPAPEGGPVAQDAAGLVTLHARDAITHSVMLRYEPATNKNCLGYWVNPADWAEWEFEVTRPGSFAVEVFQGCGAGMGGSEVEVEVGGRKFKFVVEDTGHFQHFIPRELGQVTFPRVGSYSLAIRPARKQAAAVMDIQQVKLRPVPERGR
jgi:hypothetical protein